MSNDRNMNASEIQERLTTVSYALEEIYKSQINFHAGIKTMVNAVDTANLNLGNILSADQKQQFDHFFKTFRRLSKNPFSAEENSADKNEQLKQIQEHFFKKNNGVMSVADQLDINQEVENLQRIFNSDSYAKSYSNSQTSMNNYAEFSGFLKQLASSNNGKVFLDEVNKILFPKSINDYLINPAQNVARYGILLKAAQSAIEKLPGRYSAHANAVISEILLTQQDRTFLSNMHLSFGKKGAIASDLHSLTKTPSNNLDIINIYHLIKRAADQIGELVKPSTFKRANQKINQIKDILNDLSIHLPTPTSETSNLLEKTTAMVTKIKESIDSYQAYSPHPLTNPNEGITLPTMRVTDILLDARKADILEKQTPRERENFSRMMQNRAARAQSKSVTEPVTNPTPPLTDNKPSINPPEAIQTAKQSTSSIFSKLTTNQPSAKAQIMAAKKSLRHVEKDKNEATTPQATPYADARQQLRKTGLANWEESEKKDDNDLGPRSPRRR